MENLFGALSTVFFLASLLWWFLSSVDGGTPEKDLESKRLRASGVYFILVAIFCRIAIVTYQMITIAELLR